MEFDGMSDERLTVRIAVIAQAIEDDRPEVIEAFLATPEGSRGGPEHVAYLRRTFDDLRDWKLGRLADCRAELARRRKAPAPFPSQKASAGLYFGPWRGFSPSP